MCAKYFAFNRGTLLMVVISLLVLPSFANPSFTTTYDFTVTVTDEAGRPLAGVNVFTDDQQKVATSTDENGKAVLKDVSYREEINFTYTGYFSLRIPFYEIRKRNGIIRMKPAVEKLSEVVVIGRRDDMPSEVPYSYDKVTKEDIAFTEAQTTVDALWNTAGVFVQKTQMGGGSPVLRGFEANRVLLVVDGVRMNNAIYRSGHLQNSITVDNAMLERMEVIYGPGSLLYGSDALGGVIHFRSKEPRLSFNDAPGSYSMETNAYTRYASANGEKSVHADLNYGRRNWASLTSLTFSRFGDLRTGSNRPDGYEEFGQRRFYVRRVDNIDQVIDNVTDGGEPNYDLQVGTAYSQMDFMQKIRYQPNKQFYTVLNFQHSTSTDVPRYDNLTELTDPTDPRSLRYAEWFYGPQRRLLASLKSRWSKPTMLYDRMTLIGAFQRIHESRLNRIRNKSLRNFQLENVYASSLTLDLDKNLDEKGHRKLMYGLDANHNHVRSESGKVRITNESLTRNAISRYPANNDVVTMAAYTNYVWQTPDTSLTLHAGLRYNWVRLHSQYSPDSTIFWPANYIDPGIGSTNSDLTWSLGATWRNQRGTELKALASKAFRSPNIDDYSQLRPRNNFMSVPNPALQPERTYNGEIGIGQEIGRVKNGSGVALRIDLTGYFTSARGLMTRRAFALPDGSNTVVLDGLTFQTRAMVNANRAYIYGSEAFAQLKVGEKWSLESKLSLVRGDGLFEVENDAGEVVFDTLGPIDHIPPVHGFTRLGYKTDKLQLSLAVRYQGKKPVDRYGGSGVKLDENGNATIDQSGTEDNLEYSYFRLVDGEQVFDGTLAWTTYNFYSSWKARPWLTLDFAVENMLDLHYRPFSSGVSAAGRNFIVSARFNFVN